MKLTPETLAKLFHDTYEEVLAEQTNSRDWIPSGSRAWDEVPTMNRRLFIAVCARILDQIDPDDLPITYHQPPNRTNR